MKRFRFRLDRVLQLRETAEDEAARDLAAAQQAADIAAVQAMAAEKALVHAVAQAADCSIGATAGMLAVLRMTLDGARERVKQAAEHREAAEQAVEAARGRYHAARSDRQALDKLKAQRHSAWTADANRAEQAAIDEVALRGRNGQGETA
jgi:flagellar export protein FliJ